MILAPDSVACSVGGIVITPFEISHCMPETNEASSINPSAHHPALFLIQLGIEISGSVCVGIRVSRLPDTGFLLCRSISKIT